MLNFDMSDGKMNGFELSLMISAENRDKISNYCNKEFIRDCSLNSVIQDLGIYHYDITETDRDYLRRKYDLY